MVLRSFRAVLEEIRTENEPINVPADGAKFVECFGVILHGLLGTQPRMAEDIKKSILSSFAAASLWQAIRVGSSSDLDVPRRCDAVRLLCFSAMALQELLGSRVTRGLASQDFTLEVLPGRPSRKPWTVAASRLGELIAASGRRRNLILVLGRQWNDHWQLPTEWEAESVSRMASTDVLTISNRSVSPAAIPSLQAMARLPLAAVVDWSVFPSPRQIIAEAVPAPRYLRPVVPGESEPAWNEHDALFYIHLRGSLEVLPSVALKGPGRRPGAYQAKGPTYAFPGLSGRRSHRPLCRH